MKAFFPKQTAFKHAVEERGEKVTYFCIFAMNTKRQKCTIDKGKYWKCPFLSQFPQETLRHSRKQHRIKDSGKQLTHLYSGQEHEKLKNTQESQGFYHEHTSYKFCYRQLDTLLTFCFQEKHNSYSRNGYHFPKLPLQTMITKVKIYTYKIISKLHLDCLVQSIVPSSSVLMNDKICTLGASKVTILHNRITVRILSQDLAKAFKNAFPVYFLQPILLSLTLI